MSTLSVPLTPDLEKFIISQVRDGRATNKADVVRRALTKRSEDEAVQAVLDASREASEGKLLYGDLGELTKRF